MVWRVYILFLFYFWLTSGLSYSWVHSHCWHYNYSFHCSCCFTKLYVHMPAHSKLCSWSWISHFVYDLMWNNLFFQKQNIFVALCTLLIIYQSCSNHITDVKCALIIFYVCCAELCEFGEEGRIQSNILSLFLRCLMYNWQGDYMYIHKKVK